MSSRSVFNNTLFQGGQHRYNTGNEGQLHIKHDNIQDFDQFELKDGDIEAAIRIAAQENQN